MNTLVDLIATGIIMLLGEEGRDWDHYGCDGEEWWALRLWTRRN